MVDVEEDENAQKIKEKDQVAELAPAEIINPIEYKMFDKLNMQKTLEIPQKLVYSFQKELAGTLQKRLDPIRLKHGADDAKQVTEKTETMEIVAGLQPWEEIDPVTGQLLESQPPPIQPKIDSPETTATAGALAAAKPGALVSHITASTVNQMRAGLPKAKIEDRSAMPPTNRRFTATETTFEPARVEGQFHYGDYYETMDKIDRQWKSNVGVGQQPSEMKTLPKGKRRASVNAGPSKLQVPQQGAIKPSQTKSRAQRIGSEYCTDICRSNRLDFSL